MRLHLGPLDAIDVPREDAALTVVLFHGYGADAADLTPLAFEVAQGLPIRWVFPEGPLPLPDYPSGRSWWDIDVAALDRAKLADSEPLGLPAAREKAETFLKELAVPWERLVLGGFSQGAMLATDLALRSTRNAAGLAILSGALLNEKEWRPLAGKRKGMPFFQSHGRADPILGYGSALKLESLLVEAGLAGRLLSFEGGHGLPSEALEAFSSFLDLIVK